jgi:hypothetical protein
MSCRCYLHAVTVALLAVWAAPSSSAWGPDGHWIVGKIAESHLSPNSARRLTLLFGESISLAEVANWADEIRPERPETAPWHYINIPPAATELDLKRDCATDDCVSAQIRRLMGILRLGMREAEERQEALKFLAHLVGDLHQPLHAGYGQDRGGNDIVVVAEGKNSNLHAFWDSVTVSRLGEDKETIATRLSGSVSAAQEKAWAKGSIRDWTWESHLLAVRVAYGGLPPGNPKQLDEGYARQASLVAEEQLTKAGIRLAKVINDVWGY